ncbi:calphotin-like [Rhagoletis pomonella]|uniref:calphotin-like n=1 Tax=Rhagoletis pomonella TaxID=28610 RepID=UPI00177EE3E6|nr:calphotin-like [Rhagoletis pomonella]
MAFKFVVLSALLAVASAGLLQPVTYAHYANPAVDAVASSHQNVVRNFDGTVSQYSKTIETPYSSVHKSDTRVSNNVYTPAVAKTVTYAAPAVAKAVYAAPAPTAYYAHSAPVAKTLAYAAPAVAKTVTYAAPAPVYQHEVPVAKTVTYAAPAVAKTVSYAAPAPVYHHAAPVAVHYSPAETSSHMSFDGFGTHWGCTHFKYLAQSKANGQSTNFIEMAFKFVVLSALLAVASAGVLQPVTYAHYANPAVDAVASSHQNVVRTFDGTVSQYSKSIETPYSSVHKSDTRVSNNVYTPAVAKTVTYAAPAVAKTVYAAPAPTTVTYAAPAPVYQHEVPVAKTVTYAAPAVAKSVAYAAPAPVYHQVAPVYHHEAPVYHHAAPVATTNINHGSAATTYTHNAPGLSGYGSSQTVHYSPADTASHMSFDGFGTHWGW